MSHLLLLVVVVVALLLVVVLVVVFRPSSSVRNRGGLRGWRRQVMGVSPYHAKSRRGRPPRTTTRTSGRVGRRQRVRSRGAEQMPRFTLGADQSADGIRNELFAASPYLRRGFPHYLPPGAHIPPPGSEQCRFRIRNDALMTQEIIRYHVM
jgi:hypothetical protein